MNKTYSKTHRLTNVDTGESIEFDGEKFPDFLLMAEEMRDTCYGLSCMSTCPFNGDIAECKSILGSIDQQNKFHGVKLEEVEQAERTYNLLELEEGEEYTCDECTGVKFAKKGDALEYIATIGKASWVVAGLIFKYKTFRKIKKELKFSDLMIDDMIQDPSFNHKWWWKVIAFYQDTVVLGRSDLRNCTTHRLENQITNWKKKGGE